MVDVSAVALSGLFANERKIEVAANNIANANTDNFKAQDVVQISSVASGVSTPVVDRAPPPPPPSSTANTTPTQSSDVSVEDEVVQAQIATYSAQANLKVLQVNNKLQKSLLDIQA